MPPLIWNEIKDRAVAFSNTWAREGYEDGEAKSFLDDFFNVFGVSRRRVATFETKVKKLDGKDGYIDLIWKGVLLVEMKSVGRSLDKAYAQAVDYFPGLKETELPQYILVSDFQNFRLYDLETGQVLDFPLRDLVKRVRHFGFLAGYQHTEIKAQDPVNIKAAEQMGKIHDELKAIGYEGHRLEQYLVRILFCLFADDTSLFNKGIFYEYVSQSAEDGSDLAMRLAHLFQILNTPKEERITTLSDNLMEFPYVNGQLFAEPLPVAGFTAAMRKQLLLCCLMDWSQVSPAIFGSMFQSVMRPEERRSLGAHYTSEENIHKVIDPLFMNDLKAEFEQCKGNLRRLEAFHRKLADLRFMDPACGCGNFLIIAYRELRLLEIEVMKILLGPRQVIDVAEMAKVNVDQFYGIEIEEFPAQIAQVAMWLIDHQMNMKMSEEFGKYFVRLPLRVKANIINDNALTIDWKTIVEPARLSYIFGNPPFQGARTMSEQQKQELMSVFHDIRNAGNLDFVSAWYRKTAEYIQGTSIGAAFVSTNSICQGEQVSILWDDLLRRFGITINFAYRTFKWSNEARGVAAVHCVIVGFTCVPTGKKFLYDGPAVTEAHNISPYLIDAPNVTIQSRQHPLCTVPSIGIGNKPIDGGNFLFTEEEKEAFIRLEPQSARWFKRWIGSEEFINGWHRYVLWLGDCPPDELRKMPECIKRVELVRQLRLASRSEPTRRLATTPTRFHVENIPTSDYIVIPKVSSEKRAYIPIGIIPSTTLASDLVFILPSGSKYILGVLLSSMHMAWVRYVAGRLKSDYRYSKDIVYNNFPWPSPVDKLMGSIEAAAQAVLDARSMYPTSSLADLYDPLTMPPALVKAHSHLDAEVEKAYGKRFHSDTERVAFLFERYLELAANNTQVD
ncbi:MAG: class I SAM-dependent DNA methyltransferase [Clostridia bacterium]|nr:class I SAM-dependent DNA methyltransferase [Clostridia bacterium]